LTKAELKAYQVAVGGYPLGILKVKDSSGQTWRVHYMYGNDLSCTKTRAKKPSKFINIHALSGQDAQWFRDISLCHK